MENYDNTKLLVGDYVYEKEDKNKIIFEIYQIEADNYYIKGLLYRVFKVVNKDEIVKASSMEVDKEIEKDKKYYNNMSKAIRRERGKHLTGKVLHIDGDYKYLDKCLDLYKEVGVYAYGVCEKEETMPFKIVKYYLDVLPDIIVITGHDLYNGKGKKDIKNYSNTGHFIKAIKEIRKLNVNVVIIAGACQSNFEALIANGADYASSPERINIHTFDPAVIAIKVSTTSITRVVNIEDAYKYIENGKKAFGGLETFGKMRLII